MARLTLFFKNRSIVSHPVEKQSLIIGRDKSSDIVIDSMAVNGKQAVVYRSGSNYRIKPADANTRLIINHEKKDDHILSHGDVIQMGQYTLSYAESSVTLDFKKNSRRPDLPYRDKMLATNNNPDKLDQLVSSLNILPRSCLQIISGEHVGKTIPLHRSLLRLGLAGNHCAIIAHRSDGYYLSHLEGDDPPVVNGKTIGEKSIQLADGSLIQIGEIQMRFHDEMAQAVAG